MYFCNDNFYSSKKELRYGNTFIFCNPIRSFFATLQQQLELIAFFLSLCNNSCLTYSLIQYLFRKLNYTMYTGNRYWLFTKITGVEFSIVYSYHKEGIWTGNSAYYPPLFLSIGSCLYLFPMSISSINLTTKKWLQINQIQRKF